MEAKTTPYGVRTDGPIGDRKFVSKDGAIASAEADGLTVRQPRASMESESIVVGDRRLWLNVTSYDRRTVLWYWGK